MSTRLSVVVFSGGRGSTVLSRELLGNPDVALTLAINGYDDGLSTGEVRRFLGDSLGPSDFRKNASTLARASRSCSGALVDLLEMRLPAACTREQGLAILREVQDEGAHPGSAAGRLVAATPESERRPIAERLAAFARELTATARPFDFSDCSLGNLVFAGSFLHTLRRFNDAVDDYCALLGLAPGVVDNVSDGTNAFLVALDLNDRLLASEADIVDAKRRNRIKNIYLLNRRVTDEECATLAAEPPAAVIAWLASRERSITVNPRLLDRIRSADLIVYSPGTQHSSLFPSYLTRGLSTAIAANLSAVKLLITNIQRDAEIADTTAVEIVEKAVYYLEEKGRLTLPAPCLITHYLINDPGTTSELAPYVPLGRLESIEDPRLVRISNYEDGVTGRHDPAKVLAPFLRSFLQPPRRQRLAVWLYDSGTTNKLTQTILEMVRAGIQDLPLSIEVFYGGIPELPVDFTMLLPFPVRHVEGPGDGGRQFQQLIADEEFDYALLFESSGMYNGEDAVSLASYLTMGRLDAVWGSRRLSVKDIEASLRLRYRHNTWLRAASVAGSHVLSAAYLVLYGRYVSDTLSGVRAIRAWFVSEPDVDLGYNLLNQRLLSQLLRARAEILETPVRFYAMSPEQVRRTSIVEGLQSLAMMAWWRVTGRAGAAVAGSRDASARMAQGADTGAPASQKNATLEK